VYALLGGSAAALCDPCGASATYLEEIAPQGPNLKRTITTTGCPNHYSYCTGKARADECGAKGVEGTATQAEDQGTVQRVPASPVFVTGDLTDLTCKLGPIALALNGVAIFSGAVDDTCTQIDPTSDDGDGNEWISFDFCSGHAAGNGNYHYHFAPSCLHQQAVDGGFADGHSPQIGWSLDGFPIYGPFGPGGQPVVHAAQGCDGGYCLDACSGVMQDLPSVDEFRYRYYMTGSLSDLATLPTTPRPDAADAPFAPHCRVGCTWGEIKDGDLKCSGGSGVTDAYAAAPLAGYTAVFSSVPAAEAGLQCGTASPPATPPPPSAPQQQLPNLLLFQPDDLPFYWPDAPAAPDGQKSVRRAPTPHMDALKEQGATFTAGYTASPMCAPSRWGLVTGRYPSRGLYAQDQTLQCDAGATATAVSVPRSKLDYEPNATIAAALRAAGYRTATVGKWHLSREGPDPFEVSSYAANADKAVEAGFEVADAFYIGNMDTADTDTFSHNCEWVTAAALDFVREPGYWFLFMNPTPPHSPDVYEALFNYSVVDTPSGTLSAPPDAGTMRSRDALYAAALESSPSKPEAVLGAMWVDDMLGAMLAELTAGGVLDSTLVLFLMDHNVGAKSTLYEQGVRIAMVARYPPLFDAGSSLELPVTNLDVAPTLYDLVARTGASMPPLSFDGISLLAAAEARRLEVAEGADAGGADVEVDLADGRALFLEMDQGRAVVATVGGTRFKLIVSEVERNGCSSDEMSNAAGSAATRYPYFFNATQLYDLSADEAEQVNLAGYSSAAEVLALLEALLRCHLDATAIGAAAEYGRCTFIGDWIPPPASPSPPPPSPLPPPPLPPPPSQPAKRLKKAVTIGVVAATLAAVAAKLSDGQTASPPSWSHPIAPSAPPPQ